MAESQHQYELMQESLLGFRARTMNLGDLVDRLPKLLKEVEDPATEWKDEFISYWWTLENVHEAAIELGESGRMPPETRKTVDDAIDGLERLVQGALAAAS